MKMHKKGVLWMIAAGLILTLHPAIYAQEVKKFSLKEAQQYAIENNYDLKNAGTDIEIAKKRVSENLATGLPQINATAGYNYNIQVPVSVIDAEDFPFGDGAEGGVIEIPFGTKHSANFGADINQLVFSGQYIVGVLAARAYVGYVESNFEKSEIEIKDAISKAYYPVIILKENRIVFDSTLVSLNKMLYETQEYYNNGFLEDTDVDQLNLLISDMQTTLTNLDNQLEIATNMLKYQMGLPADTQIEVTDNLDDLLAEVNRDFLLNVPFEITSNIDYKILKDQEKLALLQLKLKQSEYYPTLNAFYSFQEDAMRSEFNFISSDEKWYPSQVLGVQLQMPIFSSGNRRYKVQQAKLELEKISVRDNQLQQGLSLKVKTAKAEFNNAYLIYLNKKSSSANAEKIFRKTEIKYKEGIATSLNLEQTYNQFLTSQVDYLTSIFDVLNKKSELEKILTKVVQ